MSAQAVRAAGDWPGAAAILLLLMSLAGCGEAARPTATVAGRDASSSAVSPRAATVATGLTLVQQQGDLPLFQLRTDALSIRPRNLSMLAVRGVSEVHLESARIRYSPRPAAGADAGAGGHEHSGRTPRLSDALYRHLDALRPIWGTPTRLRIDGLLLLVERGVGASPLVIEARVLTQDRHSDAATLDVVRVRDPQARTQLVAEQLRWDQARGVFSVSGRYRISGMDGVGHDPLPEFSLQLPTVALQQ